MLGGNGGVRTLTLTPTPNMLGTVTITVTASDGANATSEDFILTVAGSPQETWRFSHFGTIFDAGRAASYANPDDDGWNNAQEYVIGADPNTADSFPLLAIEAKGTDTALNFIATQASGPGYDGLIRYYDIETTATLYDPSSWTGLSGATNLINTDPDGIPQSISIVQPQAAGPHFYRLKVHLN